MTDLLETKTATSSRPSHFAYNVRNSEGGDNYWIRIGSAQVSPRSQWTNRLRELLKNYPDIPLNLAGFRLHGHVANMEMSPNSTVSTRCIPKARQE